MPPLLMSLRVRFLGVTRTGLRQRVCLIHARQSSGGLHPAPGSPVDTRRYRHSSGMRGFVIALAAVVAAVVIGGCSPTETTNPAEDASTAVSFPVTTECSVPLNQQNLRTVQHRRRAT